MSERGADEGQISDVLVVLLRDLRLFSGAKSRIPREELLERVGTVAAIENTAELEAHRLALTGDFVESARYFLRSAAEVSDDREDVLRIASGLLTKAGKDRRKLKKEFLKLVPRLRSSRLLPTIALKILGQKGVEELSGGGVFAPEIQAQIDRDKFKAARRLLDASSLTDSTLAYIRVLAASPVMKSRQVDDQMAALEASILLSSRLRAMQKSDHPHVRDAAERLGSVVSGKKLPSPLAMFARIKSESKGKLSGSMARQIASVRTVYSAVYEGHGEITEDVNAVLLKDIARKPLPSRGALLLVAPPLIVAPAVHELVPRENVEDNRAVAVACADISYFRRFARGFIASHRAMSEGAMPHIHVMTANVHHPEIMNFARDFPGLSISTEVPAIEAPFYYATNRFLQFENLSALSASLSWRSTSTSASSRM